MNDLLAKERKLMNEKQKIEIENIRKQYQNEIDVNYIRKLYSSNQIYLFRSFENLR